MPLKARKATKEKVSVFDHHIQCILQSGLLLDEDMDCILLNYNPDDENNNEKGLTICQKLLGALSFTSTVAIVHKKLPLFYTTISATPFILLAIRHLREIVRMKNQKRNLETVIDMARNISKLNRMIFEYFKVKNTVERHICSPSTVGTINPYTKRMKQLIETIFNEEINLLIFIRDFGTYVPSLKTDYAYLENLELQDFSSLNVKCINDCVSYLRKLCDIYVLVVSNCFTCLALTLCPNLWSKDGVIIEEIYAVVPKMKKIALTCYSNVSKKFDDVKYHYLNKAEIKIQFKKPKLNVATKLQVETYNTMAHTVDILEKSQIIYQKLQKVDLQSLSEKEKLGKCICELRGHVFDYYESLDVLYKLYQININASQAKPLSQVEVAKEADNTVDVDTIRDASLNPTEPSDDEEYELYIGGAGFNYQEEQESRRLASILSQELKHKLKTHAQFIAARKKRGIIDEEPESSEVK
ncbi:uncharacterized protein BDFB_000042, partial [Asbolus verrucosus]